jgi:hypothetical protein
MAESRVVNYQFNAADLSQLQGETDYAQVNAALGYLTTWNFTFPTVNITIARDYQEMTAVYLTENGKCGYVIGAVWNGVSFGYHS